MSEQWIAKPASWRRGNLDEPEPHDFRTCNCPECRSEARAWANGLDEGEDAIEQARRLR